jgi:putative tryptophan/tyrosine transport system substrate-binding protein
MTGFSYLEPPIAGKWLELLKAIAPRVTRAAYIFNPPAGAYAGLFYASIEPFASKFSVETRLVPIHDPAEFEPSMAALAREPGSALIIDPDGFTSLHRELIIALAARYRLPAMYPRRLFTATGGLASSGVDAVEHFRQVASYLDRILRGEQPADLPVQQPAKFELLINLKTARALGLDVPATVLARADELID